MNLLDDQNNPSNEAQSKAWVAIEKEIRLRFSTALFMSMLMFIISLQFGLVFYANLSEYTKQASTFLLKKAIISGASLVLLLLIFQILVTYCRKASNSIEMKNTGVFDELRPYHKTALIYLIVFIGLQLLKLIIF